MRRLLALVLAAALVFSSAPAATPHIHEYLDHDHPEHVHGLAAHDHAQLPFDHHTESDSDHLLSIEAVPCTAGTHAVSVRTTCTSVPQVHVDVAEVPGPSLAIPAIRGRSAFTITDVRVHGPPFLHQLPARAPPTSPPA